MSGSRNSRYDYCLVLSILLGITAPVLAMLGYIAFILLEPEQSVLNNVMAGLVFSSHSINASIHLVLLICYLLGRNLIKETAFLVVWSCWLTLYLLILISLIFLSYYSLLDHFTARLALHLSSFLLILTGAFIMQQIIRNERMEGTDKKPEYQLRSHTNQIDVIKDECTSL